MNRVIKLARHTLQMFFFISILAIVFANTSCDKDKEVVVQNVDEVKEITEEEKKVQSEDENSGNTEIGDVLDKAEKEKESPKPPTPKEIGYAYGAILAKAVKMNHLEIDVGAVYKGLLDYIDEENIVLKPHEDVLIRAFAEGKKRYASENLKKQEEFLEVNKTKEGVITRESGLQYKVLKKAEDGAAQPKDGQKVKVIYEGKALGRDANFDSSNGEAVEFSLENVVDGWKEMVPLMHVGEEVEVYIPSDLGYKESGISYQGQEIIPPNALLIFKIQLVEIIEDEKVPGDSTKASSEGSSN